MSLEVLQDVNVLTSTPYLRFLSVLKNFNSPGISYYNLLILSCTHLLPWGCPFFCHLLTLIRSLKQNEEFPAPQGNCMPWRLEDTKEAIVWCHSANNMGYRTHWLWKDLGPHPPLQISYCHISVGTYSNTFFVWLPSIFLLNSC